MKTDAEAVRARELLDQFVALHLELEASENTDERAELQRQYEVLKAELVEILSQGAITRAD